MGDRGWIGTRRSVLYYLRVVGADHDERGFILRGGNVWSFLGLEDETAEIVIDGDVDYFIGGKPANLAAGLRATSYGTRVIVY